MKINYLSVLFLGKLVSALTDEEKRNLDIVLRNTIELCRSLSVPKVAELIQADPRTKDIDPKSAHEYLKAEVVRYRHK